MKKFLAVILSLLMVISTVSVLAFTASAAESGSLGDGVNWEVNNQTLTISTSSTSGAAMPEITTQPWSDPDSIHSIIIASGITSISAKAFAGLNNLEQVQIYQSVTKIDATAFIDCPSLQGFVLWDSSNNNYTTGSNGNFYVVNGVLFNKDATELIRFPASSPVITKTNGYKYVLSNITTVTEIGDYAFQGCTNLTSLDLKEGQLDSIGKYAFSGCTSLTTFDGSNQYDLTSIGEAAFEGCTSLNTVKLWNTLDSTKTDKNAFTITNSDGSKHVIETFHFYGTAAQRNNLFGTNSTGGGNSFFDNYVSNKGINASAYFIKYDPNNTVFAEKFDVHVQGDDATILDQGYSNDTLSFQGWSTDSGAKTPNSKYAVGTTYTFSNVNLHLYAVYSNEIVVSYDANGGTGAPASQTKTENVTLTLSSTKPTRNGFTFLGWATSSSATSATYQAGGSYTDNKSVTLYAVWEATGPFDITYNYCNGSAAKTLTGAKTKNVDYTITETATKTPTTRYEFLGWSTTEGGAVEYTVGSTYSGNDNLVLYAVYQDNGPYDVYFHYDINDTSVYQKVSQSSKGAGVDINVEPAEYKDHDFLGWATDSASGSPVYYNGDIVVPTADIHLYPCYKEINYTESTVLDFDGAKITVNYRNMVEIIAEAHNVPLGYGLAIYSGREYVAYKSADVSGDVKLDYVTKELTSDVVYTVKVVKQDSVAGQTCYDGNSRRLETNVTISVKSNLLLKLVAFLRGIFFSQPVVKVV